MKTNQALSALRHHVTGAIARGEAQAITEIPATTSHAHTPGPWKCAPVSYMMGKHISHWAIAASEPVAVIYPHLLASEANARLIAAAPELIDALERISTAYDDTLRHPIAAPLLQAIYGARAAIAKARG